MRSLVLCFILICTVEVQAVSKDFKASNVLVEAESSFARGDLLNSNRFYGLALIKTPQALESTDIENIVVTKFIALPYKEFLSYCKSRSNLSGAKSSVLEIDTRFYCAKTIVHSENYLDAIDFIEKIPGNYQRLEYHFLKASLYLKLSKTPECLKEMETAQLKVTDNTSLHFRDLIQVIHARCLLAEGRYVDAISKFQSLSVNSDFYLTTLEEQAWAHFKARNLTSARDILKILISYFTGQDIHNQIFGADVYFRTKYLQAYIELISQNRDKSKEMFSDLKNEILNFKKVSYSKMAVPPDLETKLYKIDTYSQLLQKENSFIGKFRNFMDTWSTMTEAKNLDNDLRYMISVNAEVKTIENLKSSELDSYLNKLKTIQKIQVELVANSMEQYLKQSKKNIDSLEFKANMGQVENFWAARTEGKRTLADVLETYKKEVTYVEDYLGK
jgi:hypothetical protein